MYNFEYKFVGNITSLSKIDKNIFEFTLIEGILRIYILSDDLIRVRFSLDTFDSDFSYAVSKTDWNVNFQFDETKTSYEFTTKELKVIVNKSPLRITFCDLDGNILSQDEKSFRIAYCGTEIETFKEISPDEKFVGLGEKTRNLNKRGSYYRMWNTDHAFYSIDDDPLYQSIPFFIGIKDYKAYGYFLDNTYESFFNMGTHKYYSFGVKNGELNYYFFYGSHVSKIIERYTELTGRMPMPPIWSLGYQQCRWSYYPDTEVVRLAKTFREKDIPLDVIYLDIDWMDNFKVFEWDKKGFANPQKLTSELEKEGIKLVTIVDPGIKADKSYHVANSGIEGEHFVKYPDGELYQGEVWAGLSYFPDFSKEKTRLWWGGYFKDMVDVGIKGFWNDMNEPAVWGEAFPDIVKFDYDGQQRCHKAVHNIYGLLMAKSTYDGAKKHLNGQRVLNVTRAGYAGIQKYSAVWTGDNISTDEHYLLSSLMVQGLGLSGVSFAGCDIGGFGQIPSQELFARWFQIGIFIPFFRNHTVINSNRQEPWSFGQKIETNVRDMIKLRYKLLPYTYTAVYESHSTGIPIVKPLFWFNQDDSKTYDIEYQYQFYFGNDIMIATAKVNQDFTKVYLPEGLWYEFNTDIQHNGKQAIISESPWDRIPIFIKAGAFIPMREVQDYTEQNKLKNVDLHIYLGKDSNSIFYEDDGRTYDYENGEYLLRKFSLKQNENNILITINHDSGNYQTTIETWKIIVHGIEKFDYLTLNHAEIKTYQFSKNEKLLEFNINENKVINLNFLSL